MAYEGGAPPGTGAIAARVQEGRTTWFGPRGESSSTTSSTVTSARRAGLAGTYIKTRLSGVKRRAAQGSLKPTTRTRGALRGPSADPEAAPAPGTAT